MLLWLPRENQSTMDHSGASIQVSGLVEITGCGGNTDHRQALLWSVYHLRYTLLLRVNKWDLEVTGLLYAVVIFAEAFLSWGRWEMLDGVGPLDELSWPHSRRKKGGSNRSCCLFITQIKDSLSVLLLHITGIYSQTLETHCEFSSSGSIQKKKRRFMGQGTKNCNKQ